MKAPQWAFHFTGRERCHVPLPNKVVVWVAFFFLSHCVGGLSGYVAHGGDHAGDGLTIPKESPDKALLLRDAASTVSCRGGLRGCCCLSPSSCSKAARNGFRETGRSLLLWLLLTGEPRGVARPGEGMAGDALRGLRNGLLELRLRFRVRPGPGLASIYERRGLSAKVKTLMVANAMAKRENRT